MHRLGLPSIELKRLHLDLIFGYKVVFGLVGVNADDFFEFNHAANTRGHAYKLFKSRSVNNIRQNFFAERIVNVWNGLPPSVSFASLSTFRRTIQKVDFSQIMKCT